MFSISFCFFKRYAAFSLLETGQPIQSFLFVFLTALNAMNKMFLLGKKYGLIPLKNSGVSETEIYLENLKRIKFCEKSCFIHQ